MSDFTDAYADLLIKQYWEQPNARAEIVAQASSWENIYTLVNSFYDAFDVDLATGDRLDIIGAIVGIDRTIPYVIAKIAFGFDGNPDARGFDSKFAVIANVAPFLSKFEPSRTALELNDADYRFFIKARIAANIGAAFMVSDSRTSMQDVVNTAFSGQAYVVDRYDMSLALYVSPSFDSERLLAIKNIGLLPKPQGVRYATIVLADPGETFGFDDNPNALGFASKFNTAEVGGRFASKVIF